MNRPDSITFYNKLIKPLNHEKTIHFSHYGIMHTDE